ncbi:hypothetical protein HK101_001895, partial [Irineochytrium annulatum]
TNGTLAANEPPDGKYLLGAWLDYGDGHPQGNDRPAAFNERIGFNTAAFQLVQTIPVSMEFGVKNVANLSLLAEGTDAAVFITIYPNTGPGNGIDVIKQSDYDDLASQVHGIINSTGRNVFIRYAPEMNGNSMVNTVRAMNPTNVAFIWSPNLHIGADPYATWYPGDAYVDWVGLSIYWKGPYEQYPWTNNTLADPQFFVDSINLDDFYQTYSVAANKPFVMSEGAPTLNLNYSTNNATYQPCTGLTSQSTIAMSFWNSFLFNPTFRSTYPKVKMFNMFEFLKEEIDNPPSGPVEVWRDFRTTVDPETLAAFKAQLQAHDEQGWFQWANSRPSNLPTSAAPSTTPHGTGVLTALTTPASRVVTATTSSQPATTKSGAQRGMGWASWVGAAVAIVAAYLL